MHQQPVELVSAERSLELDLCSAVKQARPRREQVDMMVGRDDSSTPTASEEHRASDHRESGSDTLRRGSLRAWQRLFRSSSEMTSDGRRPLLEAALRDGPVWDGPPLLAEHHLPTSPLRRVLREMHHQMAFELAPSWRAWWYRVLGGQSSWNPTAEFYWPAKLAEGFLLFLILSNVVAVIVLSDTSAAVQSDHRIRLAYWSFECFSIVIFTFEYMLRAWTCLEDPTFGKLGPLCGRLRWARAPLPVLDLLSIFPFLYDAFSDPNDDTLRGATMVRLLRLFSLMRLERGFGSFARISIVIWRKGDELLTTVFVAAIILIVSSSLMFYLESPSNPTMCGAGQRTHAAKCPRGLPCSLARSRLPECRTAHARPAAHAHPSWAGSPTLRRPCGGR